MVRRFGSSVNGGRPDAETAAQQKTNLVKAFAKRVSDDRIEAAGDGGPGRAIAVLLLFAGPAG